MTGESVLVTGGAGYIGSHAVLALQAAGLPVVVLDDFSTGDRAAVPSGVALVEGSVGDAGTVARLLERHRIASVMHFAGSIVAPESVAQPLAYYGNNTVNSHALIETCAAAGVRRFIFSSTAAVYGTPARLPVDEEAPPAPLNPYGASKLMTERMLQDAAAAEPALKFAILRYFNVAGADPEGRSGQRNPAATHLIKVACQVALGQREELLIYGDDYPTADGTGVRDYIHVTDLVEAHLLALRHLEGGGDSLLLNCGYGRGYSVREVVAAVEAAAGRRLPVRTVARRPGDAAELVAAAGRIREVLGWRPRFDDLGVIVESALAWERRLAAGAAAAAAH